MSSGDSACNTITLLPPPLRTSPRSPIVRDAILSMVEMCGRFPGCVMVWITNPFDKVFLTVIASAVVEDLVDFEFISVIDGGRFWRRDRDRAMVDRVWGLVWAENRYVKDWVYLEGFGKIEF